ncbi:hypothetical protein EYZ11_010668 [Aspergillus tanneri]|uniref:Uncharacterized protein n=1 Tax=Aspergillus tanneri TaxID=1220188 RepID=A0A4S3J4S8_9EURO|nr:hypothetical protein EYZ11_010668 [Aspergillus tanneri]
MCSQYFCKYDSGCTQPEGDVVRCAKRSQNAREMLTDAGEKTPGKFCGYDQSPDVRELCDSAEDNPQLQLHRNSAVGNYLFSSSVFWAASMYSNENYLRQDYTVRRLHRIQIFRRIALVL